MKTSGKVSERRWRIFLKWIEIKLFYSSVESKKAWVKTLMDCTKIQFELLRESKNFSNDRKINLLKKLARQPNILIFQIKKKEVYSVEEVLK